MFDLILLACGLVALAVVSRRFADYERRLAGLEAFARQVSGQPPIPSAAMPPPLPPTPVEGPIAAWDQLPPLPPLPASPPEPRTAAGLPPPIPARAAAEPGLEERLGSRWAVWVGGLALGLGGIFLVRYSIEQDLIGPRLRIALGLLFAAALLATGEWLRRREEPLALGAFPSANIPAILTAAGTSTAFATIYAAYALYELVGPAAAFVLLGLVSLLTMAAAILHGPALAALGLLAALASPLLVESREPSPVALVLYLAFATGSAYAVARLRLWRWLALAAAGGAWLWGGALLVSGDGWVGGTAIHLLVQVALAILFLVYDPYRSQPPSDARIDVSVVVVLLGFALIAALAGAEIDSGTGRVLLVGALVGLMAAAAFRIPAGASGLGAAGLLTASTLLLWRVASEAAREPLGYVRDLPSAPVPEALTLYVAAALALNALILAVALLRFALGRDLRLGPAAWYAGAATLAPLASLIAAYWRVTAFDRSVPFALVAAALGAAFAVSAGWLRGVDPDERSPAIRLAVGALA